MSGTLNIHAETNASETAWEAIFKIRSGHYFCCTVCDSLYRYSAINVENGMFKCPVCDRKSPAKVMRV